MSSLVDRWKADLLRLAPDERAELAHFLLDSLEPEDPDAEAAWEAEASRLVREIREGKVVGRPLDDVLAELRELYP